ncbi:hypothetical protein ACJIZ3_007493 [Penstemon smallii]|uniref:histone acetyltransferase n=1 Tax=Penstemon smallii TaxID=265156 RepID=A0ABD3SAN8_9LAMI
MNLQTHHSGQISGQVPNQSGTSSSGIHQQNVNRVPGQMQNPIMHRNASNMDPSIVNSRIQMQQKILQFLMNRQGQQSQQVSNKKMIDLVKRFEDALFKSAATKEEYLDLGTLRNRLLFLIQRVPLSNQNQQSQHANSSPSIGTMIPTPGLQQQGSSLATHSNSNTIAPSTVNSGSFLPTVNGSSGSVHGAFTGRYQHPSAFSANYGGNNMGTSRGVQRMTSQMIPTPGFNDSNNNNVNNNSNNQSFMNVESDNNVGAFEAVESTIVSQPMQQKQQFRVQNNRNLHNLGGHMDGGIRSTLQKKSYGLPNGSLNGGLGMTGNNVSLMNGPGTTDGYLTGTIYGNTRKPMHQPFDQHQRPIIQGDGYGNTQDDASGSENLYVPVTSVGSMTNSQSLNAVSMQSMPERNSHLMTDQSAMHAQQVTNMKPQSVDHSDRLNFNSQYSVRENLVQPQQPPQFEQQPSHQFQSQQLIQHQAQQKHQSENQILLKKESFSQSQLSSNMVPEANGNEHPVEGLQSLVSSPFQFSDMQSQFQPNLMEDHSRATQFSHPSAAQGVSSPLTQTSDQMQQTLGSQRLAANSQDALHSQGYSQSQDVIRVSGRRSHDPNVKDKFDQRLTGQDAAELNNLSLEESVVGHTDASRPAEPPKMNNSVCRSNNLTREKQFKNQGRWLLFLRHARRCPSPAGQCLERYCLVAQKLIKHMDRCKLLICPDPRCRATRTLLNHNQKCRDAKCPVCIPVRNFIQGQLKNIARSDFNSSLPAIVSGSCKSHDTAEIAARTVQKTIPVIAENREDLQPSTKRMKLDHGSQTHAPESESSVALVSAVNEPPLQDAQHVEHHHKTHVPMKSEVIEVKMEIPKSVSQLIPKIVEKKKDNLDHTYIKKPEGDSIKSNNPTGFGVQDVIKIEKEMAQAKRESMSVSTETASKSGKPKIKGVSMTELFTPEQVREHITGLRQWVGQSKAKAEKNQSMEHSMSENSCQLCAVEKLTFEPPPTYCTPCGARIKRNAMYYTIGAGETRHFLCIPCYNEARGDTIVVEGTTILKARMEKKKNDEETEEWWVQCDKCELWQHQICALFNGRRNDGGQAEYTCPNCYIEEVERGERMPLPQSAVLGAKDLPRTILSDHIEQRLFAKLKQERQDRARLHGKSYDEVPGADSLVVRVVSSVDKKLEVKPRFLEIFQEENFPIEFPYKSKVVLLFQMIEGVEVCLFGMYVQEFGSECQQPNHRRVYLSYLDSVKYFRPEVKAVTGEALRTFVYHEILIAYLEYCKMRGFTSCYIWACPPLKGEDYILYCHPEIQKTPKSDKLREWYLAMLRKATKENIVVELTNLYDHFFVSTGECKAKVTAARLPYFDGDYWPGAAEDIIFQLQQEEDGKKQHKKGPIKKTITKRALKASGQMYLSGNASKDLMLMHKLGETISPMKEDFIMVHLQHACTHCGTLMVSGNRWVCRQCKKFELCDKCYEAEQKREDRERHPIHHKDIHAFYPIEITDVLDDTKDKDEILESEFFDTRQAFLSLCQGNHYQYDTLRRAKHSSMMVLYHLHNPTAPAFVATCNMCTLDIETGQGWRCETCPEYDLCNACYQKDGGIGHPHKLTNHPSNDRDAQNKEARQLRVTQLRKMLELLVHAYQCRSPLCKYPNCRKVKGLFRHGMYCKIRASGGCLLCKKMWYLLQLHSRACKESECNVPRCRDLKEHMRRLQQQSDSRRRAAVMEMMRQRAMEVAGT